MILPTCTISALVTHMLMLTTSILAKPGQSKFKLPNGVCEGKVLCEKVPDYPIDDVRSAIRSEEEKHIQWFGTDPDPENQLSARLAESQIDLCPSRQEIIFPEAGLTADGDMKLIVNDGKQYKQGLRIEVCQSADSQCQFSRSFPNGYRTKCVQKYIIRQMIALGDDGTPVTDHFKVPSCCACAVSGPNFN